ncbi:MAG: hypothetical protein ACYC35_24335 [Pirellulales bacterium]
MVITEMWKSFVEFLVWQPVHIWCVSGLFGVLFCAALVAKMRYARIRSVPLLAASLVWLAYGFWEREAVIHRWDIRIDLFFGWPVLFGGTVIAVALFMRSVIGALDAGEGK